VTRGGQGVPLVDDSVGEEVSSLLTFGRSLARKSSTVSSNTTSWSCLRKGVAVLHRFHPAYSVDSAVEFEQLDQVSSNTALLKCCEAQYGEAVGIAPVPASAH